MQGFCCRFFPANTQSCPTEGTVCVLRSSNYVNRTQNRLEKGSTALLRISTLILLIKKRKLLHLLMVYFCVYHPTALTTVFLMTLSNMIGPSFLNCQASIIPWTNSVALILALAIKCAQRYVPSSRGKDKCPFSNLVSGLI